MVTLADLYSHLNQKLEISLFKDSCPNGLQVEGKGVIKKGATAVTSSLETIQAAVKNGVDVLIVHHGLFWNKDEFPIVGTKQKKLKLLLENGISLLAYHLPLDAHRELGNNWKAAQDLGWQNLAPFGLLDGQFIGVKGNFPSMPREEFKKALENYYGQKAHDACGGKDKVQKAALISGGAYRALTEAAKEGMDCFISGNFDEPAWHHAFEENINFFALGHTSTEKVGPKALADYVQKTFGIECSFLDFKNPF